MEEKYLESREEAIERLNKAYEIFSINRKSNGVKSTSRFLFTDFFHRLVKGKFFTAKNS